MARKQNFLWRPQPGPQQAFATCPVQEIFFGGARGGGKTDGALGRCGIRALKYGKHYRGYFIRRELVQLEPAIARSKELFTPFGNFNEQKKSWTFKNGATLRFRYIDKDKDAEKLQGESATDVNIEEIGNFPDLAPLLKLKGILRSTGGVPVSFTATGNPGGVGHAAVKRRYIDPAPGGWQLIKERDPFTGLENERIYIPSRISDNKLLLQNDPTYLARLAQTGSEELVKAWLDGDFDAIEGAFFTEFSTAKHVIPTIPLPGHWTRFRAMDWGAFFPFYVGWFAIASEHYECPQTHTFIPKGAIVQYREYYGSQDDNNQGLKMPAGEVGLAIQERDHGDRISFGVLDPSAFKQDGGPSVAERMARATKGKVFFRKADNRRLGANGAMGGWDTMRSMLRGFERDTSGEQIPMLYFMACCPTIIRLMPLAQHHRDHPEDLELAEDHALDAVRYACMSRGVAAKSPTVPEKARDIRHMSLDELFEDNERGSRKRLSHRV